LRDADISRVDGEFWSGTKLLHELTKGGVSQKAKLKIGMSVTETTAKDSKNKNGVDFSTSALHLTHYVQYDTFAVGNAAEKYKLTIGGFVNSLGGTPTSGDSLGGVNGQMFTTIDQDNDVWSPGNCAKKYHGGWWYSSCHSSNLNGVYASTSYGEGLNWRYDHGYYTSMSTVEMAVFDGNPWIGSDSEIQVTTVPPSGPTGSTVSSQGGFYDGPATSECPSGTSTIDIDFNKGVDDFGNAQGTLRFTGKQGFVVYFTDDDSTGNQANGVEITNQQSGNCHKAGNCNANQASKSGGFVLGSNNKAGDPFGTTDPHTSGIIAVFNQGASKVSFMDTDDDGTVKAVFAYDKDGNFIGQSEFKSRQDVSIDTTQTKDNRLIYSLEFDTKQGTAGGSNDGTVFT
jgi:hypothetical protein